jgi:uncharacterized protein with PQ loop repeat
MDSAKNKNYCPPCKPCPPCEDETEEFEWIGDLALFLNIISTIPQLYHVYSKRDAKSLSWMWIFVSFIANILWIAFGYNKGVFLLMKTGSIFATVYLILGIMKYKFDR